MQTGRTLYLPVVSGLQTPPERDSKVGGSVQDSTAFTTISVQSSSGASNSTHVLSPEDRVGWPSSMPGRPGFQRRLGVGR